MMMMMMMMMMMIDDDDDDDDMHKQLNFGMSEDDLEVIQNRHLC